MATEPFGNRQGIPLLTTKLYVPPPRSSSVSRPHLIQRLDEGLHLGCRLALVSAPAGYGKTTLLSQWASQFIQAFSGSHHYILDYLTDEVLVSQPEPIQIFLLRTSILDRLTAPLCDALIPEHPYPIPTPHSPLPNTQSLLEHLDAANLFIVPLDSERRWYRYHRLFADLLRARLEQSLGAPGITSLHSRAARWYESQGMLADAVKHALEAGEFEHAARLVE